ncbi:DNA-binding transcriptional regulator, LysR family [Chryseobacterium contaminans]|uniref:DNA-binding transcriptional regulator, LysR family n=2 Tax=Chryseobacterium contaminans TaxID=1423959 RepID=A0A1M7AIJ4_9FLAO|nr:DNA-binding transcriptional regulator, LysR family [Chryseobacterium contaminans]
MKTSRKDLFRTFFNPSYSYYNNPQHTFTRNTTINSYFCNMFDYRLKVFHTVASRLSFTKASEELHISQPAVTKHIKEIEVQLSTKLFDRKGTSIQLTQSGKILFEYAEKIRNIYRDLEFEISQINQQHKGKLIIGASTTVAQYILPEILAKFNAYYKDIKIELLTGNTEAISALLKEEKIDLGIIEGESQSSYFDYRTFKADEIVLTAKTDHPLAHRTINVKDLYQLNLIFREQGSGTLEFIQNRLKEKDVNINELNTVIQLGSSESIKNYLLHSDCMAFLSISTILNELKNNVLTVIDIKNFSIERDFHFILPKGEQSELIELFLRFAE